ncbi:MAG: hypothetical protein LWX83_04915 [Anaerolineae bacterium]|nr:hypothetical protein [Anaerolineae bacterium]
MKKKWIYILAVMLLVLTTLSCGLPVTIRAKMPETATPNVNLTAVKMLETLLTPAPPTATATETPTATPLPTATPTPEPTLTFTPSVTNTATQTASPVYIYVQPTAAAARYAGLFYAYHFWSPPTIDGAWDEWGGTTYNANYVTYGASQWTGEADLSSSFKLGWDNNYLYIAAKVRDDQYAQHAGGQDLYLGDSLEILLDADLFNDFYTQALNYDDYQMGISAGNGDINGSKEAVVWFPKSGNGTRSGVRIASMGFDGGYRVEAAIPWSDLGAYAFAGQQFGFVFSVSDNDDTSQNLQQSMVSSVSGRKLTNPTTWGELILSN